MVEPFLRGVVIGSNLFSGLVSDLLSAADIKQNH